MSKRIMSSLLVLMLVSLACASQAAVGGSSSSASSQSQNVANSISTAVPSKIGHRTKTSGCQSSHALPDPTCTPGAVLADATKDKICVPGYITQVRNVTEAEKNAVFAEYGILHHSPGEYEVDHLISLELGGSNSIANLWPQPAEPRPGFHEKDKVENYLHDQVCSGALSLQQAQTLIATDWLSVYNKIK